MKGVVFTELIEMIENECGLEVLDQVLEETKLSGVYTTVGDYPESELFAILDSLGKATGLSTQEMLMGFSKCFFHMLSSQYQNFFEMHKTSFDFLSALDSYIHPEALQLYPGASVPGFAPKRISETKLELIYTSKRKMPILARGLIEQTSAFYKEKLKVEELMLEADGSVVKFILTKDH